MSAAAVQRCYTRRSNRVYGCSSLRVILFLFARESCGLREKVVALREAGCLACRCAVMSDSTLMVSSEFQQMCSDSVQTVMFRKAGVRFEGVQQFQAARCTMHHRHRDRMVQHDHWVVGHAPEQIVECEDLRPIGVICSGSFVVNGGDGGLQLVRTHSAFR